MKKMVAFLVFVMVISVVSPAFAQDYSPHLKRTGFTNLDALEGGNTELAFQGDTGYIGSLGGEGLKLVDLSDTTNPDFLYNIPIPDVNTMDVKVQADPSSDLQDVLAASTQGQAYNAGFFLYDISDPENPVQKSFTKLSGGVHNLFIHGEYLYATRGGQGMAIYDISDLSNPVEVASFTVDNGDVGHDDEGEVHEHHISLHDIFVQANGDQTYAYLPYWDAGIRIVDVTDPANPVEVGSYEYPTGNAHYAEPTPDGNYLLVGDEVPCGEPGGIHVLDIRDLSDIQEVGFWEANEANATQCAANSHANEDSKSYNSKNHAYAWTGHNFTVENDVIYQGGYKTGVNVIDISDKTNPVTVSKYRNTAPIGEEKKNKSTSYLDERPLYWGAYVHNDSLYAVDVDAGLLVFEMPQK